MSIAVHLLIGDTRADILVKLVETSTGDTALNITWLSSGITLEEEQ